MKIKVTSIYVNDQDKALRVYTDVLGFIKKADFAQGPFRWLTVASPESPDGTELQLALNDDPEIREQARRCVVPLPVTAGFGAGLNGGLMRSPSAHA